MKRGSSISDILKPLGTCKTQAYLSNVLQVADILEWILSQVGNSKVWLTSFSISEEFIRRLYFIRKKYDHTDITLVLDLKATQKIMKLWIFLQKVIPNVYLTDNHSKIILVKSMSGDVVAVVTSQNLTRGNRHESSFITSDPNIFYPLLDQVRELIKNKSAPLNDLLSGTTRKD